MSKLRATFIAFCAPTGAFQVCSLLPSQYGCMEGAAMPNHDIMIIGASAGGLEALIAIIRSLPAEFPAALFIVTHMAPAEPSLLPDILSHRGPLPAIRATEGMAIEPGRIYCATPDHHLLIEPGHIH